MRKNTPAYDPYEDPLFSLNSFRRNLEQILGVNEFCTFDNELIEIKYKFKNKKTEESFEVDMNFAEIKERICQKH